MLSPELRLTGFSSDAWLRLLALFGADGAPRKTKGETHAQGSVVVIENEDGSACAAFHTELGSVTPEAYAGRADLPALCERHLARRGVVLRRGVIEEITERASARVLREEDFAAQWLALLSTIREVEREGLLYFWPPRTQVPIPSPAVLTRMLDTLLPDGQSFLCVIWEGTEVWTALCVRRRGANIDLIAGPDVLLDVSGPLGGDYRRDHRAITRAVSAAIGPVHLGLFAQREDLEALLRDARPGAWARAVTLRDLIVDPAPAYVHVAVSADAVRATAKKTSEWLGGLDFFSVLEPVTRMLRDQITQVASVTGQLGWNPLQALATRLRARDDDRR